MHAMRSLSSFISLLLGQFLSYHDAKNPPLLRFLKYCIHLHSFLPPLILSSNMAHCLPLISCCPKNSSSLKISTNALMQNYAPELCSWACPHLTSSSIFSKDLFSLKMSLEEKVEICCQAHKVEREYWREAAAKRYAEIRKGNICTDW